LYEGLPVSSLPSSWQNATLSYNNAPLSLRVTE
jgi:hypothetical protein